MKKLCVSALMALALMLPGVAKAESTGVYVAPKFAMNVQHIKDSLSGSGYGLNLNFGSDSGSDVAFGGAIAIGYDFSKKFDIPVRAELEYAAYGNASKNDNGNDISKTIADEMGMTQVYSSDVRNANLKTEVGVQTLLANVYWDITTWKDFTPYVSAGIGVAFVKTKVAYTETWDDRSTNNTPAGGLGSIAVSASDSKAVLAGQIGFGCSYAITDTISADLGYRFLMMGDCDVDIPYEGAKFKLETSKNYAHQIMLGLRVTF